MSNACIARKSPLSEELVWMHAWPDLGGGGGRGVSEEVKILGEASPLKLSTTKGSQKYMQISYSVTPLPESLDLPMACTQQKY